MGSDAWQLAAGLVSRWLDSSARGSAKADRRPRVDELLDSLPKGLPGSTRGRCQNLVFGVIRHFGRLESELGRLVAHPPRFETRAALFIAGYELIENPVERAKIIHHAVEQTKRLASPAEARLVNAVARRLAIALEETPVPPKLADAATLASYFSHPEWLVRRWLVQFGAGPTRQLLEWNQQPAPVYARLRASLPIANCRLPIEPESKSEIGNRQSAMTPWLQATAWPGWLRVSTGHWAEVEALVASGAIYIQDPATRLAVDLLAPEPGEVVLDACAAPGGKSLQIADRLGAGLPAVGSAEAGRLVALDLPGPRIERLKQNLARTHGVEVALVPGDLTSGIGRLLGDHRLPTHYRAILLDVPCSNTGVMRHRVDVKWRLDQADIAKHAVQQGRLLRAAARLLAPGGRLVYSTCSLEREENEGVVQSFLDDTRGRFELKASTVAVPWTAGHDGAAAFLLQSK